MYNEYINKEEFEEIKSNLLNNNVDYKSFLKYYKLAIILNDKDFCNLLVKSIPNDLTDETEEKYYELVARLNLRLKYRVKPF